MGVRVLILMLMSASPLFADAPLIQVAVFQGPGVGPSARDLIAALHTASDERFAVVRLTSDEILNGGLADIDVLVHPGGSGSKQGKALGNAGREIVRKYIHDGGGYLGVCGGAYLATNVYDWSLNLIDANVVDRMHWARGNGTVTLRLSPRGSLFFQRSVQNMDIHYGQGPLLAKQEWDDPNVPEYESLAIYASEIAKKGAPKGIMKGTSAIVRSAFGKGRVFCFSPHPELTDGQHQLIPLAVDWLASVSADSEH